MVSKSVAMYFLMLSSRWFYNGFSRLLLCCDILIVRSFFCGVALWYLLLACCLLVARLLFACCSLVACLLFACGGVGRQRVSFFCCYRRRLWVVYGQKKGRNLKRSRPLYFVVSSPKITRRDGLPQKDKHQRKCRTLCKHRD